MEQIHGVPGFMVGVVVYSLTMLALSWYDEHVLPDLQDRGIMPVIPGELQKLSTRDKEVPYLNPTTMDRRVALPAYAELKDSCFRIGVSGNVAQYICVGGDKPPRAMGADDGFGVCERSDTFSKHYGTTVWICKRKQPAPGT